ncbi:MAG: redoxin domain-containing protein, partial [Bdellovibrionota bacterium]
ISGKIQVTAHEQNAESPEVGQTAPSFRAISFDGKMVDIKGLRGKRIWLIFYRYATCPLCNLHLSEIGGRYALFKQYGLEIVAVFETAVPQFFKVGGMQSSAFPIISDTEKKLYSLYRTRRNILGVLRLSVLFKLIQAFTRGFKQRKIEGQFGQLPSHFLIDENGIIQKVHHGKTAVDHIAWSSVGLFGKIPANLLRIKSLN